MNQSAVGSGIVPQWDIADRMRKALRTSGHTVQDMADYLDVSRGTVSTWINGRIPPSTQTVRLWALRTGVPYEWLAHGVIPDALPRVDSNHQPAGWWSDLGGPPPRPVPVRGDVALSDREILAHQRRFTRSIRLATPGRPAMPASADLPLANPR